MADNTLINLTTVAGGDTIATLEVGGVKHEKVIVEYLVAGVPTMVNATSPFPVTASGSVAVSNMIAAVETGLAKSLIQTDGTQKTQIPSIAIETKGVDVTTIGDTTIHTPAAGKKIKLIAFGYSASGSVDTGNIKVMWRFGAGANKNIQYLTGNQAFSKSPGNGKYHYEGGVNEALIINLSAAANIAMNIDYEEI